jgi:hypothetical protein
MEPGSESISDWACSAGSRSAFITPLTTGNRTRRDPDEDRGAPREEDC